MRTEGKTRGWGRWGAILFVAAIALGPIVLLALWSLAHSWFWPDLLPREWSLRSWRYVFSPSAEIFGSLGVSLGIALAVTGMALFVGLPAARVMALHDFPGKRWLLFMLLLPVLAPPLASTMGMHALFLRYGLADTAMGVVLAHLVPCVPYTILVLTGSFSRLDTDLEAQARSLGATRFQTWRHVTLPLILPGVAVAGAFAFLISWSQYLSTLIIGGGRVLTLPLSLVAFQRSGDESLSAALSLVFLAPAVAVFLLVGRIMVEGPALQERRRFQQD